MVRRSLFAVAFSTLLCLAGFACSRSKIRDAEPEGAAARPPTSSSGTAGSSPSGSSGARPAEAFPASLTRPAPKRLVAIGDLHGDLDVTRRALRLAGAIDANDAWVGGDLVVVQTGDAVDRGDDDRKILDLLERLKVDAKKAGGELIALSGNHELMNSALDFRYVTPGAFAAFADVRPSDALSVRIAPLDAASRGRAAAFAPSGPYANMIAERPIFAKVGDSVFAHGGVLPKHVRYGLERMNDEVRGWLLGKRAQAPSVVMAEDGPVWTRMYSASTGNEECAVLTEALAALGAKRMVVGHTVQRNGINAACDDRVWRIDTGLSKTYGGKLEVLDLSGGTAQVRRLDGGG